MDFVVGHPRSGTGLITRLLNASSLIARHEYLVRQTQLGLIKRATEYYEGRCSAEEIRRLIIRYAEINKVCIDCSWKNTWILPPLMDLFPQARILHLVRDPRNNVVSCHNLDYYGQPTSHRWRGTLPLIRRPDWDQLGPFQRNCVFWAESHRLILDSARNGRKTQYFLLRLEELARVDPVIGMYEFFELSPPPRELILRILSTKVNTKEREKMEILKSKSDVVPCFHFASAEVKHSVRDLCGPVATQLGYSL
jgi:hypothetical protein